MGADGRRTKNRVRSLIGPSFHRWARRTRNRLRHAQQRRFDSRFGVDTAGLAEPTDLELVGPSAADATHYEATWRGSFRRMIASLHLDLRTFTFIDVGSGKGAVLLYASEMEFKQVTGYELATELHRIAESNLAEFPARRMRCQSVTSINVDAAIVALPVEPLVLYLCNPFGGPTLTQFLDGLEASVQEIPRPVHVVSFNPAIESALDDLTWLRRTGGGWNHATFQVEI